MAAAAAALAAVIDRETGAVVCAACDVAATPLKRMRGLLGREGLHEREGLLLRPAPAIHTWFMGFAIDAVFLDEDLSVLKTVERMPPWRAARCRGARAVLELPAGTCAIRGIREGRRLALRGGRA